MSDISLDKHNLTLSGVLRQFKSDQTKSDKVRPNQIQSNMSNKVSDKVRQSQTKSDNVSQSQTNVLTYSDKNFDTVPRTSDKPTSKM